MAKRDEQEHKTTTRSGQSVRVKHGQNGKGETVSLVNDGWGYETMHVDPARRKK